MPLPPARERRSRRALAGDARAASDVVGSMLLVAITVAVATGLGLLIQRIPGPEDRLHADLSAAVVPGAGGWGTGDEEVRVVHQGGEALRAAHTRIVVRIDEARHEFADAGLGGAFADGSMGAGETWIHVLAVPRNADVVVDVLYAAASSTRLAASAAMVAHADPLVTFTYVATNTPTRGSVAAFPAAQNAADAGAEATLTEGDVPDATLASYSANGVASSGSWSGASNGFASDNAYATTTTSGATVRYRTADPAGSPGAITAVVLKAEVSVTGWTDDGFTLQACNTSSCSTESATRAGSAGDQVISYDVTGLNPNPGSWTWTHVTNLEMRVKAVQQGVRDGTWRIDHVWAEVTYDANGPYALDVRMDHAGLPAADTHRLELRYRVTGDSYRVQVWDGASWNLRGAVLDAAAPTTWTYDLTAAEVNGGAPALRFVDQTPGGATMGTLLLDYVRVRSTEL